MSSMASSSFLSGEGLHPALAVSLSFCLSYMSRAQDSKSTWPVVRFLVILPRHCVVQERHSYSILFSFIFVVTEFLASPS